MEGRKVGRGVRVVEGDHTSAELPILLAGCDQQQCEELGSALGGSGYVTCPCVIVVNYVGTSPYSSFTFLKILLTCAYDLDIQPTAL